MDFNDDLNSAMMYENAINLGFNILIMLINFNEIKGIFLEVNLLLNITSEYCFTYNGICDHILSINLNY